MNLPSDQPPPIIPPAAPNSSAADEAAQIRTPIANVAEAFEAVLRQPARIIYHLGQNSAGTLAGRLAIVALVLMLVYGEVVGAFSGGEQLWAAPLKIVSGLAVTAIICLPSLYIFACLGGSRASLREVGGLVAALVALMAVLLAGFAPVAWVFSQSTESVAAMGLLHILFTLVAVGFGLRLVRTGLSTGGGRPAGLRLWAFIFVLVLFQMATALRPLVGTSPDFLPTEKKFFLSNWFDTMNAEFAQPRAKDTTSTETGR